MNILFTFLWIYCGMAIVVFSTVVSSGIPAGWEIGESRKYKVAAVANMIVVGILFGLFWPILMIYGLSDIKY